MQEAKRRILSKKIGLVFLVCAVLVGTQGCGKKGPLNPPPDEVSTYPATYPQHTEGLDVEEELGTLDDQGLENWAEQPLIMKENPDSLP